jgi:hypothetical protein
MTDSRKTRQTAPLPPDEGETARSLRWYFVCPLCNAKWFHTERRHPCPRCGKVVVAADRLVPPWRR